MKVYFKDFLSRIEKINCKKYEKILNEIGKSFEKHKSFFY